MFLLKPEKIESHLKEKAEKLLFRVIEDRKLTQEQKDSISRANLVKANQAKKSSRSSSRMDHSMEVDSGY